MKVVHFLNIILIYFQVFDGVRRNRSCRAVCDASELELAKTTATIRRPSYRPVQTETAPSGQLCCKRAATLVICQLEWANWQLATGKRQQATWLTGNMGKRQHNTPHCHNADATATAFDLPLSWPTLPLSWPESSPG